MQEVLGGLSHCLVMGGPSVQWESSTFHGAKLCGEERSTLFTVVP